MMRVEEADMETELIYFVETAEQVACKHRWLIAPVSGPTSEGHCRLCGMTRAFYNHAEDTVRNDSPEQARALVLA